MSQKHVYGLFRLTAFSPGPEVDEASEQTNIIRNILDQAPFVIIQLAPGGDMFRGIVSNTGWKTNSNTVMIGHYSDLVILLKDSVPCVEVTRQLFRVEGITVI